MSFEMPQCTAEASGVVSFVQPASVSSGLCLQPYTNIPNPLASYHGSKAGDGLRGHPYWEWSHTLAML